MKKALILLPLTLLLVACGNQKSKVEFKIDNKEITQKDLVNDLKRKLVRKDIEDALISTIALKSYGNNPETRKKSEEILQKYKKSDSAKLKELIDLRGEKEEEFLNNYLIPKVAVESLEKEFLNKVYIKPELYTYLTLVDFESEEKAKEHLEKVKKFIESKKGEAASKLSAEVIEKFFERRQMIPVRKEGGLDQDVFNDSRKQDSEGTLLDKVYKVGSRYLVIFSGYHKDKIKQQVLEFETRPTVKNFTNDFYKYYIKREGKLKTEDPALKGVIEEYNKLYFEDKKPEESKEQKKSEDSKEEKKEK